MNQFTVDYTYRVQDKDDEDYGAYHSDIIQFDTYDEFIKFICSIGVHEVIYLNAVAREAKEDN